VGRDPELERLLDCWQKAKRSEGQVVLVYGSRCWMSGIHA